jgi:hypothetical protein
MSSLRRVPALQSLTSLQLSSVWFGHGVDFGCLGDLPSLRALRLAGCNYQGRDMGALSRLTQLESLAIVDTDEEGHGYEPPISGIAALTRLTSLDISIAFPEYGSWSPDLDEGRLRQLQPVLGGLARLGLNTFGGVQDAALLAGIGCTALSCHGFEGCAEPPGSGPLLPRLVSLQLTASRQGALCPLVLRHSGLTSLSLLPDRDIPWSPWSDADCPALAGAFPQLRALQLTCLDVSAASLAHLSALQQLQQLGLARWCSLLGAAELRALGSLPRLRRLVVGLPRCWYSDGGLGQQPVAEVEAMLARLAAGGSALREVVVAVPNAMSRHRREATELACDRAVGGSGRQDLAMEVRRIGAEEAWEWMLAHPVVG